MLLRVILGAGLFAFGYYLGREVGRHEPIREELEQARKHRERAQPEESGQGWRNPEFQDGETD